MRAGGAALLLTGSEAAANHRLGRRVRSSSYSGRKRGDAGHALAEVMEPATEGPRRLERPTTRWRPDVRWRILRPADLPDITAAVRWASESGLAIGVRGGGHSVADQSSPTGALLIDVSRWRGATVDPTARTADALAGSPVDGPRRGNLRPRPGCAVRDLHRHRDRWPDPDRRDQLAPLVGGVRVSCAFVDLIHGRAHRIPESWAAFGGRAAVANVTRRGRGWRRHTRRTRGLDFGSSSGASIPRTVSASTRTSRLRMPDLSLGLSQRRVHVTFANAD